MKNFLLFVVVFFTFSCKNKPDSAFYFTESQPQNVDEIKEIPIKFFGNFTDENNITLQINKNNIIQKHFQEEQYANSYKDSLTNLKFIKNYVIDISTKQKFSCKTKNDSVYFIRENIDTLNTNLSVLKTFKNALILNYKEENGKIYAEIFKKEGNEIRKFTINNKENFEILKKELNIDYDIKIEDNDTLINLKPTRADFRKILRKNNILNETIFKKI